MKIGVDTESLHLWFQNKKTDIFGFIDIAEQMGFEGVMINTLSKKNQEEGLGAMGPDTPENVRKVGHYLKQKNMFAELAAKGTDPKHLSHMIEVAEEIDAGVVRTYISYPGSLTNKMQNGAFDARAFERAAAELKEIEPMLAEKQITLAIENHELETCDEIRQLVEELHSPWIGVHFDIGNTMMAWEEPLEGLRKVLPYIKSTHIKDHIICREGDRDVICGVPLGRGNIQIDRILQEIAEKTKLQHIIVEMCYPYACPFRRVCGAGGVRRIGDGTFSLAEAPIPSRVAAPSDYYSYEGTYLQKMLQLQYDGLKESMEYIKKWQKQSFM